MSIKEEVEDVVEKGIEYSKFSLQKAYQAVSRFGDESVLRIEIKRLEGNDLDLPKYETSSSAGMDLRACITENITIKTGERKLIKTGLAIALPENYEAQIRPRSGLALKNGITVLNTHIFVYSNVKHYRTTIQNKYKN